MGEEIDPDQFSTPFLATKTLRRDPYPAILPTNPSNSQRDRIIIITGASVGLGEAAAKVWARAGAKGIVITARNLSALNKLAEVLKAISPSTNVLSVKTDISNEHDVKNLFAEIQKTFGRAADVLLNNAGLLEDSNAIDTPVDKWWKTMEVNVKGLYSMTHHFINSQPNPRESTATVISVSSGRAGFTDAGGSAYNISKIAEQRFSEHLQIELPHLRVFTTMPGIVMTAMQQEAFFPFAKDHADLTGMLALYLVQPRADFLKGSMVSVNWDVEELEEHKGEIVQKKALMTSWMPILPLCGGKGLGA
ncbi:NAD(P)-binding protein [Cadophora sp. DSE1049]|nr:NAD(P)-binding protein [Cadophora sp. DSE1049]